MRLFILILGGMGVRNVWVYVVIVEFCVGSRY